MTCRTSRFQQAILPHVQSQKPRPEQYGQPGKPSPMTKWPSIRVCPYPSLFAVASRMPKAQVATHWFRPCRSKRTPNPCLDTVHRPITMTTLRVPMITPRSACFASARQYRISPSTLPKFTLTLSARRKLRPGTTSLTLPSGRVATHFSVVQFRKPQTLGSEGCVDTSPAAFVKSNSWEASRWCGKILPSCGNMMMDFSMRMRNGWRSSLLHDQQLPAFPPEALTEARS